MDAGDTGMECEAYECAENGITKQSFAAKMPITGLNKGVIEVYLAAVE